MKILLDTHVFLWYISGDKKLPKFILQELRSPKNKVYLSTISLWEIVIKYQLGRLPLPESPEMYIPTQRQKHRFLNLDIDESSVKQLIKLPPIHRDPFDRLLICSALEHGMTIATVDHLVEQYSVPILQEPDKPEEKT